MVAKVVVRGDASGFAQTVESGGHRLQVDEPEEAGGTGTGPDPYVLLLGALGACTSMTVAMYARRKGWSLRAVRVELEHDRVHEKDCEECVEEDRRIERITVHVALEGELTGEQRGRLMEIAARCPVHRTLAAPPRIRLLVAE
jgi:putative redox protein